MSEFDAGAKRGMHADRESFASYSEELQARVYEQQLAMLERQPEVAGEPLHASVRQSDVPNRAGVRES